MTLTLRWLGHAGFRIKTGEKNIYIDPHEGECSEKADLLLITHSHFDHCNESKIKDVRTANTMVIAPKDVASKIGGNVKILRSGEEASFDGVRIKAVDAYNTKRFRSPGNPFHPKSFGVGYLIMAEDKVIYHAGDTDFIPEMGQLGQVDVALLPTGGTYTMDNADAAEAVFTVKPEVAIPMHRWDTDPTELKKKIEATSKIKVVVLRSGEEYRVI